MPPSTKPPLIALAPEGGPDWMADAVLAGGGQLVGVEEAHGLIWANPRDADGLARLLDRAGRARGCSCPWAGVERFIHLVDDERVWSCAKGVYADAGGRAGADARRWPACAASAPTGEPRRGALRRGPTSRAAGPPSSAGVASPSSLLRLLQPFDCHVTVVRNRVQPMEGADVVLESDRLTDGLAGADLVVLALSLTPETDGIISESELRLMESHAWLVNVARGRHIVTDDLVAALREGTIGGAGLDVTDPEPLPDGHPLWSLPNCIITPHVGNTPEMAVPLLAERIKANVRRYAHGEELIGLIDPELGY